MTGQLTLLTDVQGAPVYAGRDLVGTVACLFADQRVERVVGLEVVALDGGRWFVPWVGVRAGGGAVSASPLVFLGTSELDFYARHGVRLTATDLGAHAVAPNGDVVAAGHRAAGVLAAA